MKNVIILLAILVSTYTLAHAAPTQDITQSASIAAQQPSSNNDSNQVGSGSGDDIDTTDEADPANDKDPEADESVGAR